MVHLGEAATHGHYRSPLHDSVCSEFWLTDDGVPPTPVSRDVVDTLSSDAYLTMYQQ